MSLPPVNVKKHMKGVSRGEIITEPIVRDVEDGRIAISGVTFRDPYIDPETGEVTEYVISLGSILKTLLSDAYGLGTKLKEAHIKDDVIDNILHENIHVALRREGIPLDYWTDEELLVESIVDEVMTDIRELPKLDSENVEFQRKEKSSKEQLYKDIKSGKLTHIASTESAKRIASLK